MNGESVSKLYYGVETSDAFEEPFAVWDVTKNTYYRQDDGTIPTFLDMNDAEIYAKELCVKRQRTVDYLRKNNPRWTEEKVQEVAIEVHKLMLKNDFSEEDAIIEVLKEYEKVPFVEIASKKVLGWDDSMMDYTMYKDTSRGDYVFVYGNKDEYGPDDYDFDQVICSEDAARDWFNNYMVPSDVVCQRNKKGR